MTQEIPAGQWREFLEAFGREHRAWIATVHIVAAHGAVIRATPVRLKSASSLIGAVTVEFVNEHPPLHVRRPGVIRIQRTDAGIVQALEVETLEGQFIRLAFRSTALPEQLDGLAPAEASPGERACLRSLRS